MQHPLTIKNRLREQKFFHNRLLIVAGGLMILVLTLLFRLAYLQVHQQQFYTTLSKQNQLSLIPMEPTRGLIYDRNGVLLAENIPVFSLDVIPSKIQDLSQTITTLRHIISISDDDLQAFYKELKQKRRFEPVTLKIKLTPEEVARFSVDRWKFPGVVINARLMRYYPLGAAMAHVVGFMGRINAQELNEVNSANYSATDYIGKVGVEKYYENQLHGFVGYQQVEIDASGRVVRVLKQTPPIAGDTVYLTIDSKLEQAAAQALGNENGAVVAVKPDTGEILALVSNPSYDPNLFVNGINSAEYKSLNESTDKPLYNRALRGLYAPGSTIKPYYGLEGLDSGIITPDYAIYDPGYFKYANHTYMNWLRSGFGWVNLEKAIIVSDDTYFYNLAVNLGVNRLTKILTAFGFGQLTSIEMNEELPGTVPNPQWKSRHIGAPWYTGDTINMGIGQGYLLATPLQLAQATAILAERGKKYQLHLLQRLATPDNINIEQDPIESEAVTLPASTWDHIIQAMQQVITNKYGTGFRFGHPVYSVAAKTGTAQVYTIRHRDDHTEDDLPKKYRDNSLFIAFAPVEHPQIAIAVVAEHSEIAASVARKVMDHYLLTGKQSENNDAH